MAKKPRKTKLFRVCRKAKDTNSFGLRGFWLFAKDGEVWEVARSAYSGNREWLLNEELNVPLQEDTNRPMWELFGCELPELKPHCPVNVINEIFSPPAALPVNATGQPDTSEPFPMPGMII